MLPRSFALATQAWRRPDQRALQQPIAPSLACAFIQFQRSLSALQGQRALDRLSRRCRHRLRVGMIAYRIGRRLPPNGRFRAMPRNRRCTCISLLSALQVGHAGTAKGLQVGDVNVRKVPHSCRPLGAGGSDQRMSSENGQPRHICSRVWWPAWESLGPPHARGLALVSGSDHGCVSGATETAGLLRITLQNALARGRRGQETMRCADG